MDKFEQSEGNPLYLKLAFEEARLWTSFSKPETLAPTVEGIIKTNMFDRLKNEGNHGTALVEHALAYLAASRHGLAEDELVDLLSRDLQVYEWFFKKTYHLPADLIRRAVIHRREQAGDKGQGKSTPKEEQAAFAWLKGDRTPPDEVTKFLQEVLPCVDGPRLPVVLWSRFSFDLAPYLTERKVDDSSLLYFYHRELGDVSKKSFLAGEQGKTFHARLGDYFRLPGRSCQR